MKSIALIGAGGKMGRRITERLINSEHNVYYVEVSQLGIQYLTNKGVSVISMDEAAQHADIFILAVPDVLIAKIAAQLVPHVKPTSMLIMLDPAAAYADKLPNRVDISYFVTHPCHTSVFNQEEDRAARHDYFGGNLARQSIVCALVQGNDSDYNRGEEIARIIYGPILRSHRISLEQMAILEPGLSETVAATCTVLLKEATEEAARRGVPYEAAQDFVLGHVFIELAISFGIVDSPFSDACYVAIDYGRKHILQSNWRDVLSPEKVRETVDYMLHPDKNLN